MQQEHLEVRRKGHDPWGSKAAWTDSSHFNKSLDSWAKASSTGADQNSSWNKAAGGTWGKDGDGWNKSYVKSTPSTGGNVTSGWETTSMDTKSTAEHGGEPSSWDKVKVSSDTQSGWDTAGWGIADSSTKNAMDGWNNPNSFGGDLASNEDIGKLNQKNSWDKPSNFEGGRGFGRGRGREDGWDKPSNFQGSGWGRGSDGNSEGRKDGWNRQTDFDRGRGSNRGRGRVRFGGRGFGDEDNQDNQGGYRGGWGSGGGRGGRGRFGGRGSGDEDNQDSQEGLVGGWSSGRGRGGRGCNEDSVNFTDNFGCGRGRSRGRFQSSDWNNDQDNFGDRSFSADPSSSWGNQRSSWNKSKEESGHIEQSDVWDGWSSKQSSHRKKDEGSNKWDAPGKADGDSLPSKRNQGSSTNAGGGDYWNATSKIKGNNWNMHKSSCSAGDFASWEKVSAGKEATGVGGGWGISKQSAGNVLSSWAQDKAGARDNNWDNEKPQNAQQSSGWHDARKDWTKSNSCGESGNSDITLEDNWNKAKPSSDEVSAKESNWDSPKSWVGKRPSDWNQSSTASELGKELGSNSGDNWSKPKPFYHGNESSKWGNDNSGDWSKPKSSSWNDSSSGFKDGDRDQSGEGWNCGSNGGRGDSFSGRGRGFCGRGRNFHGGRSSDWSGGRITNREDQSEIFSRPKTFGGQSSNWNDEGFTSGNKSDWNAKENAAEKGSWDNWNAKKVSDGNESKTSGWNSPSLSMKEGEQKDGVFGTGSSSKGEQGGGWGGGSFNKGKFASNWNNDGSSAKNGDDVWVSKSTAPNQPQASGWNNQKQSDDGGEGNWGKAKGNNGGIWEW